MSKKRKKKMLCPSHSVRLIRNDTEWGIKYECPTSGCTVACWAGSTSTPADAATRQARMKAHAAFDLHHCGRPGRRRYFCYTSLSRVLGIPQHECHMGMMSREQCERVVMACEYGLVIDNIIERDERHAAEKCVGAA